ncbi:MAG: protein tyrosine phosphatase family protein [Gammaproteobacteria bacterium]
MAINDILNFIQVSHNLASSGQPDEGQLKQIADSGYQLLINLAMPDSPGYIAQEKDIIESLTMDYIHIPVPFDGPNIQHLNTFIKAMQVHHGKKTWIHCALNYRVSAFLYLYRKRVLVLSEQESIIAILPEWVPDKIWTEFMKTDRIDLLR